MASLENNTLPNGYKTFLTALHAVGTCVSFCLMPIPYMCSEAEEFDGPIKCIYSKAEIDQLPTMTKVAAFLGSHREVLLIVGVVVLFFQVAFFNSDRMFLGCCLSAMSVWLLNMTVFVLGTVMLHLRV